MQEQFEIIANGNASAEVLMYGDISRWAGISARDIDMLFSSLRDRGYQEATFRVHSPGGSVMEGFAILGVMANYTDIKKTFVIEGIAASMMTIVMLGGDNITMLDTAQMMIHAPSGGAQGDDEDMIEAAKQIKRAKIMMAKKYAERTGKTEAWVLANLMPSKKDVWLDASEALAYGLIDNIKSTGKKETTIDASLISEEIIAKYNNEFLTAHKPQPKTSTMESNKRIIGILGILGTAITATIEDSALFDVLEEKVKGIKAKAETATAELDALKAEAKQKELDAFKAEMQAKGLSNLIQEKYLGIADKAGLDIVKDLIKDMPSITDITPVKASKTKTDRDDWDYSKWEKEDPKGLAAMLEDNPEGFKALLDANLKSALEA